MEIAFASHEKLKEFVSDHELMNNRGIIQFNAVINIVTAKNKIDSLKIEVMITFDGYNSYGKLSLLDLDNTIDSALYPTEFEARWQTFEHINGEYLEITGSHTKNKNIGEYSVKIIPLERLRK